MTPSAKAYLLRAKLAAADSMPNADDVAITNKAASYLASLCAQLELLCGFAPEGEDHVH
jgi:hypothetical protein